MRLKYLTLNKIVDATYCCGIVKTPVAVMIAAPPGTGKTWSTRGIADNVNVPFVDYITGAMSATQHRKTVMAHADKIRLLIHDDIGLCSRFDQEQIFATYMMVIAGTIEFKQWKTIDYAKMQTSVIICCTLAYWADHEEIMRGKGLLDRLLPIALDLSNETRRDYQKSINIFDDDPPKRTPEIIDQGRPQTDLLIDNDVSPRWMRSLSKISQFMSADELLELIAVLNRPMKYEV